VPRMPRAAFTQIVNRSMAEVLTRSLATSFCTLLPVTALLLFGGTTLKDFAFALMIGIASGAYSSIFIASPVLTHWKEREPSYRTRRLRILHDNGTVPAYATTAAGAPDDVEPSQKRRRTRSGRLTSPEEPGQQISRDEFKELVQDLGVDGEAKGSAGRATATAVSEPEPPAVDPAADLTPEDLVLKDAPKPRQKARRPRNRRHGRSR
jgi:SecD/SecF fusion protein